jgi:mRNA-degrading endonuclease RelE of RelBE toxin-antitoxin system
MRTVVETPSFVRQCAKIFSEGEKKDVIDFLALNPLAGDEIPGTGGVRKLRFASSGRGKSGGARVIYYYLDDEFPIYALLAYAKNSQDNLSPEQSRDVSAFVDMLKASRRRKQ